ncbi:MULTISPECIES: hypothetical protein [unclassified Crossiella]|uniref:hypothetical protein n=1 Tax=unclassified Crossiella TaxID=2620835 RepID=UPI001FFF7D24|nr:MULTISPECIES: hypothetical protein [unclassified Crossiella]MCK2238315.1 hypothetical protein [Crossiella sp. S99.2]MCK2256355.1 hypothetical protein [Crossiella sp. S99.1]
MLGTVVGVVLFAAALQGLLHTGQGRTVLTGEELIDAVGTVLSTLGGVSIVLVLFAVSAGRTGPERSRALRRRGVAVAVGAVVFLGGVVFVQLFLYEQLGREMRRSVLVDVPVLAPIALLLAGLLAGVLMSWAGVRAHRRVQAERAANVQPSQYWLDVPR